MANRYNFSVQRKSKLTGMMETFGVEQAASFDEARKEVEKGIHDQELKEEAIKASLNAVQNASSNSGLSGTVSK